MSIGWLLALAVLFVALNGFFVLSEFALVKARTTRLQELAENGNRGAKRVIKIGEKLDSYLSATQLGITLASLALGWLGEPAFARIIEPPLQSAMSGVWSVYVSHVIAVVLAFVCITFLHTVIGEVAPKAVGIQQPERFAMICARPLMLFHGFFQPIVWVLNGAANNLIKIFGFKPPREAEEAHSEEELRLIVASSHRHGILDASTRDLLDNVLDYTERVAREVMTPRRDVIYLDATNSIGDNLEKALTSEFTRYPLVDPRLMDRVLGFVHLKDLFNVVHGRNKATSIAELARPPVYVPETLPIDKLRRQMQARHTHFAVVVDEFGEWTGIVTLEDLLEELVGEIQDELDVEEPKYQRRADGTTDVDGSVLLDQAQKKLDLELPDDTGGVTTLGGYVFSVLGRQPAVGDQVILGTRRVEILDVEGLRIRRLRVMAPDSVEADSSGVVEGDDPKRRRKTAEKIEAVEPDQSGPVRM